MPCRRRIEFLLSVILLGSCSGCLFAHNSTNVVRSDELRRSVRFESPVAREAFSARAFNDKVREKATQSKFFAIPFLFWYSRTDTLSDNAFYNDQVAACDANHDGVISVEEALAYNPTSAVDLSKMAEGPSGQTARPALDPEPDKLAPVRQVSDAPTPEHALR